MCIRDRCLIMIFDIDSDRLRNRFVFFDGLKFPHGMAINDDRYHCDDFTNANWNTYRVNQVFFYEPICGN